MSRGTAMSMSTSGRRARAHDELELLGADDRVRRRRRGDDDVGLEQALGQLVERDDRAAEALGERARAVGVAVGDEDRRDALVGQRLGGQLARLAGADDHDARARRGRRRPRAARSTATVETLARPRADPGLGAHALAGLQRGGEQAVGQRPGRAGGQRELVGAPDLALDLGLADDHRLQAARDAEELARGVAVARRVDDVGELGRADAGAVGEARRARRASACDRVAATR